MFGYYIGLAIHSFQRNKVITALTIAVLGLGIGACITTFSTLTLLSGDPAPSLSSRLFTPELDPLAASKSDGNPAPEGDLLTYFDAMNLIKAHKADQQAAVVRVGVKVSPRTPGRSPFMAMGLATTPGFFRMLDIPFEYGTGWSAGDGKRRARVVVISRHLNDKLFGGRDSVGRLVRVADRDYTVIGVLKPWNPRPHFYSADMGGKSYGQSVSLFVPLRSAIADNMNFMHASCWGPPTKNIDTQPCAFLAVWVKLDSPAVVAAYRTFLSNYAQAQVTAGRFHVSSAPLPGLMRFLSQQGVVPKSARVQAYLGFAFLLVCVVGTVGLLLAKCLGRSPEIGVRRALGASRAAIFAQFMVESGTVGLAGGVLGVGLTELGLWGIRSGPAQYAHLAHLDPAMVGGTFLVAVVASLVAGVLPAWRACTVDPMRQLKVV